MGISYNVDDLGYVGINTTTRSFSSKSLFILCHHVLLPLSHHTYELWQVDQSQTSSHIKTWSSLGNAQPAISPTDDLIPDEKGDSSIGKTITSVVENQENSSQSETNSSGSLEVENNDDDNDGDEDKDDAERQQSIQLSTSTQMTSLMTRISETQAKPTTSLQLELAIPISTAHSLSTDLQISSQSQPTETSIILTSHTSISTTFQTITKSIPSTSLDSIFPLLTTETLISSSTTDIMISDTKDIETATEVVMSITAVEWPLRAEVTGSWVFESWRESGFLGAILGLSESLREVDTAWWTSRSRSWLQTRITCNMGYCHRKLQGCQ